MIPKESVYADWDKLLDFEYNKFDPCFYECFDDERP